MQNIAHKQSLLGAAGALAVVLTVALPLAATPAAARETVAANGYSAGTIVIKTSERRLYYYVDSGHAIRYPVGVGRAGMQWQGTSYISGKYRNPDWSPPASIAGDYKKLPRVVPGGSPQNPMGVAAMTLAGTDYAIHGTNSPGSIGGYVSHGCIRMFNQDITDLFNRVGYLTTVVVTR